MTMLVGVEGRAELRPAAALFRSLGDPVRLTILRRLAERDARVVDLTTALGLAQATVSAHLCPPARRAAPHPCDTAKTMKALTGTRPSALEHKAAALLEPPARPQRPTARPGCRDHPPRTGQRLRHRALVAVTGVVDDSHAKRPAADVRVNTTIEATRLVTNPRQRPVI